MGKEKKHLSPRSKTKIVMKKSKKRSSSQASASSVGSSKSIPTSVFYSSDELKSICNELDGVNSSYWQTLKDSTPTTEYLLGGESKNHISLQRPNWIQWNIIVTLDPSVKTEKTKYKLSARKLAAASEVFDKLLLKLSNESTDFLPSTKHTNIVFVLDGDDDNKAELDIIMEKMQSNSLAEMEFTNENISGYLRWARILRIRFLTHSALNYCFTSLNAQQVQSYLTMALSTNTPVLVDKCKKLIAQNLNEILKAEDWIYCPASNVREITSITDVPTTGELNEQKLVDSVLNWAKFQFETQPGVVQNTLLQVLFNIRFQSLPSSDCYEKFYPAFKSFLREEDKNALGLYILKCQHTLPAGEETGESASIKTDRFINIQSKKFEAKEGPVTNKMVKVSPSASQSSLQRRKKKLLSEKEMREKTKPLGSANQETFLDKFFSGVINLLKD